MQRIIFILLSSMVPHRVSALKVAVTGTTVRFKVRYYYYYVS